LIWISRIDRSGAAIAKAGESVPSIVEPAVEQLRGTV
jgi:hypothetical protein